MVHVVYSNRAERLLARLIEDMRASRRQGASPFEPLRLVVPNKAVETFIRFGLARTTGFAGNLDTQPLRRFVQSALPENRSIRVIDTKIFQGLLLLLFFDRELLQDPALGPVRDYLYAAGTEDRLVDLRRYQLSAQLARLFDEYSASRAELLEAWKTGLVYNDETERWQRTLWLKLLERAQERETRTGVRWLTMPDLVRWIAEGNGTLPKRAHIFWVSGVARFFESALREIAKRTELFIYALNPSRAFWDDTEGTRGPKLSPEGVTFTTPEENPVLQLWGRAGRENVKVLNGLSDWNAEDAFEDESEPPTLLEAVRADMLDRKSASQIAEERTGTLPDESFRVLACPTIRREAETIATEIWSLIRADEAKAESEGREPLRFNDIAVLVNPREAAEYFTHLTAAFTEAHELPHCIVDEPFVSSSPAAEAVSLLVDLPLGRFTRAELLRLVTHPLVMARYPDASADEWIEWCERLGIVHGADRNDHAETYIQQDILNWDQGVRRLALGAFLPGERSGVLDILSLAAGRYLPEEMSQSNQTSAAQFGLLVRSLISDARFAKSAVLKADEWLTFFTTLITTYVQTPTPDDERELARTLSAIQEAFALELDEQPVSYTIAHSLAKSALQGLSGTRGSLLARGVVISTASAIRSVPFKAIFWAGLGEGLFPAPDRNDQLDLRRLQQLPGDVSLRDSDKYLFLETLLSARERVTLSYVARDALTGESRQPASVVTELQTLLAQGYLGRDGVKELIRKLPVHRYGSPEELDPPRVEIPEASREHRALALRQMWFESLGGHVPKGSKLIERIPKDARPQLLEMLRLVAVPEKVEKTDDSILRIPLSSLRRFLECPLQGHAQTVLGMGETEEEDLLARKDEPFETDFLRNNALLTDVCLRVATQGDPADLRALLTKTYDKTVELGVLSGRLPSGVFSEVERQKHLTQLQAAVEQVRADHGTPLPARVARFGQAEENADVDQLHPPIELDVEFTSPLGVKQRRKVQLYGRTELITTKAVGSLMVEWRAEGDGWIENVRQARKHLRSFLDQVALTASGVLHPQAYQSRIYLVSGETVTPVERTLPALDRMQAVAYLQTVTADLLSRVHAYTLPLEAVLKTKFEGGESYSPAVDILFGGWSMTPSSAYGPVPNPGEFPRLSDSEAEAIVQRRFGPFLGALGVG